MKEIGNFLVEESLLNNSQLSECLELTYNAGLSLNEIILSKGLINPYILYKTLATFHNLEFADLKTTPCDKKLLNATIRDEYLKLNAIPWRDDDGIIIIATSKITASLKTWAKIKYGKNFRFAITTPFDISHSINNIFSSENDFDAREKLWQVHPEYSAKERISWHDIINLMMLLFTIITIATAFPAIALSIVFIVTSFFYATTMLFKTILLIIGYFAAKEAEKLSKKINLQDSELPIYTILIPLYREERTLPKLVAAIEALDYPKSKLDVKLIVEADDALTIGAIKSLNAPRIFEMITVPYSLPRTKPKACNYALRFARGEFVTIYDAEDIPDPDQLKKVLYKFYYSYPKPTCVQARLNYFNRNENLLTRMFAIEYSTLFDFTLFSLEKIGIPIPLGGTSNHFRTETLHKLYAWDPYNVTEDADLGLRIAQKGWHCSVVWSLTQEEAPISLWAWIKQRTRWIKGHMQTYLVHMRHPISLYKKLGLVGFMGMQFFLGAPTLIFLISPLMWFLWSLFMTGIIQLDLIMPEWFHILLNMSILSLFLGIFLQILFAVAAIQKNQWKGMLPYSLIFPFYWILHSIASFRALWQLIKCPHYWEKTTHGVSKVNSITVKQ